MQIPKFGCRNSSDKIGVLIAQLGTPEAPTKKALRPYLKQFLSDRRIIELNRVLWWAILNGIILNTRPKRSARLYARIWTEEGSPLMKISKDQTRLLKAQLTKQIPEIEVELGMRYGEPSLTTAIDRLLSNGVNKILLVPMYPQYSATTTASIYDMVFPHLLKRRVVPTLKVVEPYYNHPDYLKAQVQLIEGQIAKMDPQPERLVLSYHGIPQSYIKRGDTYCCMCLETTRELKRLLNYPADKIVHTFQSRFGREPWLTPYTDETFVALAKEGIKNIAVVCPGFVADCLETLDEMGNEGSHIFKEHGGESLKLIPCLNDYSLWIDGLSQIVFSELGPWLDSRSRLLKASECVSCSWQK